MKDNLLAAETVNYSRLRKHVIPKHYFVTIRPNLKTFTFSGYETIDVEVNEKTKSIVLHSLDIEIQSAVFVTNINQEQKSTNIEIRKSDEVAILTFANSIDVGFGQLKLEFTGEINDLMLGCYRSKYIASNGELRYGLATKFECTYCRRAFPCWDEPELRTKFDLTLIAPKDRIALSNMNIVEETDDPIDSTKRIVKFATTPIMSTYLLGYVIGEYDFVEQMYKNVNVRVYTPLNKSEQGKFALDLTVRVLELYETYFKISYPLPKLDLIAISDFQIAGMEQWGLITFRESALLYDPHNCSSADQQFVAKVVCHEVAHQWFGNLVTMQWWADLWLKEGFASFLQYFAVDRLLPEFNIWESFIIDQFSIALQLDALHNSHPIQVPVEHTSEIEEIFDIISYYKGSSIIRMLYDYIGNEAFQNGLHQYLTKFAYKNAVTDDLWDSLEEASKKPIRSMMSTWTEQMGYPLISFTSRQDGSNRLITLTQEKFSIDGVLSDKEQQAKWLVPISIITQNNRTPIKFLLEERTQEFIIENVEPTDWIKLNSNMIAFYRVNYTSQSIEQLQPSIANKSLSTIDRLSIQEDVYNLVRSGKMSSDVLLKLLESYVDEDEQIVWQSIIGCLSFYNRILAYTDFQEVFHIYVRKLLSKIYSKIGIKPTSNEDHQTLMLRASVLSLLVSCKDPQVMQDARAQFDAHVAKLTQIAPDLRNAIYCAVASDCDDKTFDQFFELYQSEDLQAEKKRIATSLNSTTDKARIQRIIDFAMSDKVRSQDAITVIGALSAGNEIGREMAWNYYKKNHNIFKQKYGSGALFCKLIQFLTEHFASEERAQEIATFFETNPVPCADRKIKNSLEYIKSNSDLLARDSLIIKKYLTSTS